MVEPQLLLHCTQHQALSPSHSSLLIVTSDNDRICDMSLATCRYDDDYLLNGAQEYEDYDDVHTRHGWEVDSFFHPPRVPEQEHVWLDPHILANPAIADIDGDGQEELVVAVSYFFDRDQYSRTVSFSTSADHNYCRN